MCSAQDFEHGEIDENIRFTHIALACASLSLGAAGCAGTVDDAQPEAASAALSSRALPEIPAALAVPAGNRLAFTLHAEGTQNYACQAPATGAAWVFQAPDADLFWKNGRLAGSHYGGGPTWEALDGSTVHGMKLAGATVDTTAIPWLLLSAASHTGNGLMSEVTFIQRLETAGGLAPATGCDADHVTSDRRGPLHRDVRLLRSQG